MIDEDEVQELVADLKRSGCCMTSDGDRLDIDLMRKLVSGVDGGKGKVAMWKIRDKTTGLFSPGGGMSYANFTKKGKTWSEKRHVMSHISNNQKYYRKRSDNLEIVMMSLSDEEVLELTPEFDALMGRLEEREQKAKVAKQTMLIRNAERKKREAEKELKKLQGIS